MQLIKKLFKRPLILPSPFFSHFSTSTLHEESAAGLNGRLARLASNSPPSDLLAFHSRLPASSLSLLNLQSFHYILEAMLADGRQMDAFRYIAQLEGQAANGFPDKQSFTILMRGLVEADVSGSLALAVDELFLLMQKRYNIQPDFTLWSLRIRAFLHHKYMNPSNPSLEPSRIFYSDLTGQSNNNSSSSLHPAALNDLNAELVITAVNRRLWSFSNWILTTSSSSLLNYIFIDKIASAATLFSDPASIPVIRFLLQLNPKIIDSIILNSIGFNLQLLLFCWRTGRSAADLALKPLNWLIKHLPHKSDFWIETAEGCLRREMPRDYYTLESEDARDRLASTIETVKCSDVHIKELENEIINQKLLR